MAVDEMVNPLSGTQLPMYSVLILVTSQLMP
nr:MAG TPA: hypothetical protein [Caudoviricetes sp.]